LTLLGGHPTRRDRRPAASSATAPAGTRRPPAPAANARRLAARVLGQGRPGARSEPRDVRVQDRARRVQLDETLVWHALRHTGASWWVMSGADIFRLSKLMGHADVKITQKTYAHLAPEEWHQDYHAAGVPHADRAGPGVRDRPRSPRQLVGRRSMTVDARETADPGARPSA
jgi:hypothetical protein